MPDRGCSFHDYWRHLQVVCTIGPATWDREKLFQLADEGMNVARLNMSHGDHTSHKKVLPAAHCCFITQQPCAMWHARRLTTDGPERRFAHIDREASCAAAIYLLMPSHA